jgi:hypothetical protein
VTKHLHVKGVDVAHNIATVTTSETLEDSVSLVAQLDYQMTVNHF